MGKDCPFAHNLENFKKDADYCKFYIRGNCEAQEKCTFSHFVPCRFVFRGEKCEQGEECRFSHTPMNKGEPEFEKFNSYLLSLEAESGSGEKAGNQLMAGCLTFGGYEKVEEFLQVFTNEQRSLAELKRKGCVSFLEDLCSSEYFTQFSSFWKK